MRAAVLNESPGRLEIEDVILAEPAPTEVLIRTRYAGLCHSEMNFMEGHWSMGRPAVMGHEAAGIVEAVGADVTEFQAGDHVIVCFAMWCGTCRYCLVGRPHLCSNRENLSRRSGGPSHRRKNGDGLLRFAGIGAFAEQMLVHERGVQKIPDTIPLDKAALIGCGVTTGLGAVLRTSVPPAGSSVAVIGCGGIGLSAIQGARIVGATPIIAIDVVRSKLEMARLMGATHTVDATEGDPVEQVKELTGGGVEYAYEAVGRPETATQCWRMVARGGTATIIGQLPAGSAVMIPGAEIMEEKRLQGSLIGSTRFRLDMPQYLALYLDGRLKLDEMISAEISLDEVNEGYARLAAGDTVRSVISFA
jgi:S-(hydroxymethyl)glutathione dehydrogenase/alcohol dehydrogenase